MPTEKAIPPGDPPMIQCRPGWWGRGSEGGPIMIATDIVKTIVLVLLGLAVLWIVVIIVKNDMQTIIRALIVAAVLGLGYYYLDHTKLEKLSFTAIKNDLFPVVERAY